MDQDWIIHRLRECVWAEDARHGLAQDELDAILNWLRDRESEGE